MIENQNESKIRKVLFNEISFIIAIVGAVLSVVFWISNPQKQLEQDLEVLKAVQNLKDNDLHTLELKVDELQAQLSEANKSILRVETILNERLPK